MVEGVPGTGRVDVATGVGEEGEDAGGGAGGEGEGDRDGLAGTSTLEGVRGADVTGDGTGTTILTGKGVAGGRGIAAGTVTGDAGIDGIAIDIV